MADYNFNLLTPLDFEELSRDLIQEEYKLRLECFSPGKDSGIDFRYIGSHDSKKIIQCKHYVKSSFSKLKTDLEKNELKKVRALKPDKYILVTSMGLTPANKDTIKEIFNPYIRDTTDILGFEDLNNLLRKYENVAIGNYKLWFTSATVMNRIIHSDVYTQSQLEIKKINQAVKIFVKNRAFFDVKKKLTQDNFCIIIGIPGIGKTTIAQYILSRYLANKYDIISIKSMDEAFKLFNPTKKQFIYYDDFLGQSTFGEKLTKNEDQQILDFLESIKKSRKTKFLLTTRSHILNCAQLAYEKLNYTPIQRGKYSVELSDYSLLERAKILYNHLWYSTLPKECINDIIHDRKYSDIISHRNFTPRIVNVMTSIKLDNTKSYAQNFFDNLENPEEVWKYAFDQQISDASRKLLFVLNTLPKGIELPHLRKAFFSHYHLLSQKYGQSIKESDFKNSLKELDGSFVIIEPANSDYDISIEYENPSIHDFINHYLMKNPEIIDDLFKSIIYFQQNFILMNMIDSLKDQYMIDTKIYSKEFVNSIKRTFYLDLDCDDKIARYHFHWDKGYLRYSFEKRLYMLLRHSEELHDANFYNFISDLLKTLITNIKNDRINRPDFFGLLDYLYHNDKKKFVFSVTIEEIYIETKNWLLKKIEYLDDFEQLRKFLINSQQTLSDNEFEQVQLKFKEEFSSLLVEEFNVNTNKTQHYYQYKSQIEDQLNSNNISEIQSFIKMFENCTEYFNVEDLNEEIYELKKKVDDYYRDYSPADEDYYDEHKEAINDEKYRDESSKIQIAIDQMFSELGNCEANDLN